MVKLHQLVGILALLCISMAAQALEINARLDSNEVGVGDSVSLTVTVDEDTNGESPDFSPLMQNFELLSTSSQSTKNIINGRYSSTSSWVLTLIPKQRGYIAVPPISYRNASTKPLKLHVVKRNTTMQGANDFLFLDASVDLQQAYVQQQIIYTLRIFRADIQIFDHTYTPPNIKNGVMEQLGEQRNYQTNINGQMFNVIELRYALFPQKSGELTVPGAEFTGTIFRSRSRTLHFDPINGKQIRRAAPDIKIQIKPKPAAYPKDKPWLPARSLQLQQSWSPDTDSISIGNPITRTITLTAEGLLSSVLPEIPADSKDGVRIYSEEADSRSTASDTGVTSVREESQAIIASKSGQVSLPAVEVTWWDVDEEKVKVATLPSREISISGSGRQQQTDAAPTLNTAPPPNPMATSVAGTAGEGVNRTWLWMSLLFGILWLITLAIVIWLLLKRRQDKEQPSRSISGHTTKRRPEAAMEGLKKACQNNQPDAARTHLLPVFQHYYQDRSLSSLDRIAALSGSDALIKELKNLDKLLYSREKDNTREWQGAPLWEAVQDTLKQERKQAPKTPLAPLYPIQ